MHYFFGGSSWPYYVGSPSSSRAYVADIETIFVAPYSGVYTFYIAADDNAYLYGSIVAPISPLIDNSTELISEVLMASSSYVSTRSYFSYSSQVSDSIWLPRGQRLSLRARTVRNGPFNPNFSV
jgi:hypothetical protein